MAAIGILVVDDDPVVIDVISTHLKNQGYSMTSARNGLEAWEKYEDKKPDIVITDLDMPQMGGEELVRKIKQKSPRTITIVLTGQGSIESAANVMRSGCDDYLLKPIQDIARISFVIRHSIERRDLLARSLLQGRVSWAKSEYMNRLCDELSNPVHGLLTKTEELIQLLGKTDDKNVFALAKEIKGYTETLVEVTGGLCNGCERLRLVEKRAYAEKA
jgi:CheY-like chemotaxis protein